jgi:hypothetical protein
MITVNWQWVIGGGLLLIGIVGVLVWITPAVLLWGADRWFVPDGRTDEPADPDTEPDKRGADEPPPPGAVAWVADIRRAMGSAESDDVLAALERGTTRDEAREMRIQNLETQYLETQS